MDIANYLQKEQKLSVDEIAVSMETTPEHVKNIINKKEYFTPEDINTYLKFSGLHFWEFALASIPLNHLPEKIKKRVIICKEISDHLKKKK